MRRKRNGIAAAALLALAALALSRGDLSPGGRGLETLKVTVLKVGKADAIVAQAGGETLVIDAGEEEDGAEVVEFLAGEGVSAVDYLVVTHFDKDHVGGADTLVEAMEVGQVILPDYEGAGAEYTDFLAALAGRGIQPRRLREPAAFPLGEAQVLVEPPAEYAAERVSDGLDNDLSLITTITHGEKRLLFAGDAEKARLRQWLAGGSAGAYDFVKMPHHGVYNTALEELLEAASPRYAVICSSAKHPAQAQTLALLQRHGVRTFQTKDGDVTVLSDGRGLEVRQDVD